MLKNPYTLLALILGIPGAYLSFKRFFLQELKNQMVDLHNESGVDANSVSLSYKILGYIFIGQKKNWINLFNSTSETAQKLFKKDKTMALRIFCWFLLMFAFSFLAWFLN